MELSPTSQLGLVAALGVGSQWLATRLRLPSILLLLLVGFAVGPVLGWLDPDELMGPMLFPLVSLSVGTILLEGGLSLRRSELTEIGPAFSRLLTIGVAVTWTLSSVAAHWTLGFSWPLSTLIGALLVVTGPTVTLPLLNFVRPKGPVGSLVKWEGIVNDPIGAVLAVLVFGWISAGGGKAATGDAFIELFAAGAVGVVIGLAVAEGLAVVLRRHLIPDYLQSAVVLMTGLTAFALSNELAHESGLLTVTVLGISLANAKGARIEHIVEFKENLRVVLIGTLFVLLAARLRFDDFAPLGWGSVGFLALLILVVRPLAVWLSCIGTGLNWREKVFLSVMAPRGIVAAAISSLFAIELSHAGVDRARELAPVVFVVIVGTVVVYGLLAAPIARKLGIADMERGGLLLLGSHPFARQLGVTLTKLGVPVILIDTNRTQVATARLDGLKAYHANALSEYVDQRVPFDGIGRLLALTPNDEVNSLAVARFAGRFERSGLYQLPPEWLSDGEPQSEAARNRITQEMQGRLLFAPQANFWELDSRLVQGARMRVTPLTEDFDFASYKEHHGDRALPLFRIDRNGELFVASVDVPFDPRPGDQVVALVLESDTEVT
ncbi:cation:proton antiporter [Engelhardtia mirabilis]|uniref:K(+)/H(+) antiporter NhaP2 n=1 Tax=Engelhardtia mirabilis TaxID=2528011 RepID=A0A518BHY0_9BACT|nr:K(+)/H(+) antiporter NhaP2 [Planctomycetes bacterium Pla133]QDV00914.1 K(+)/H(+) antiporter NhaP2 [Planctomycetes bacterium Pla86]